MARGIMSLGIILLLGNSISTLLIGIDQWFIKFLMDKQSFAIYSFAASMERIMVVFVTPITTVLYNYFCKEKEGEGNAYLKQTLLIWSFLILATAYPLRGVVHTFVPTYNDSAEIIFILFCGQALNCIISGIYLNKYKAEKRQNYFLLQMVLITILSIALNTLVFYIFRSMESIAYATLITKLMWLFWCEIDSKTYKFCFRENMVIVILITCFIASSCIKNGCIGFLIYLFVLVAASIFTMKETCLRLVKEAKGYLIKFRKDS